MEGSGLEEEEEDDELLPSPAKARGELGKQAGERSLLEAVFKCPLC